MSAFTEIQKEINQTHDLRKPHLEKISKLRGNRAVVSLFITFFGDYPLMSKDSDMVEEVLSNADCSNGISLIIDAPGGDGLAAERLIQVCRSYTKKDFETIVPARAKSAATMVCLGSDRILLSPTSELGPIDPQVYYEDGWVAAYHLVKTYDELFAAAVSTTGKIEPYLQQLTKFDAVVINDLRAATKLSESIAVTSLKTSMLKGKDEVQIRKMIERFTNPELTLSHGRALNHELSKSCGLNIELMDLSSELWKEVWALYTRSNFVVDNTSTAKIVETIDDSYTVGRK
ncbi:MAG: hypothetical protein WCA95_11550 [Opitutaceae bacterium]